MAGIRMRKENIEAIVIFVLGLIIFALLVRASLEIISYGPGCGGSFP